ncbi:UDP-N-acetylglucosamine 1-carboxyvinyltransferase [Tepidibacillus infernus]|uniref:UDP-N-acetylglucosamine 1-carboxyvinyltransferase n=1 Tax=Tepidibacillus TaxID=1494427 RepID=UPI00085333AF|nr:UDP-N-acetylglucosamine 1-carboxyvinyltransferase [Tepidibacillus sp. HK-1]GBF11976.1 UDP-N-acetylglucosamine 1-carboxyvinyltransferase 1 [Tepidibacillus sp. HK-1]
MEKLIIEGGRPLSGKIKVQGAKNAALPILAASLLAEGTHVIQDVPHLLDIDVMIQILRSLGAQVDFNHHTVMIDTRSILSTKVPEELMRLMRSSIFLMGPLLARFNQVSVSKPGGCAIGERKIDLHLKGLEALGAKIIDRDGLITCTAKELVGTVITLDYPSVGATENIMMAAVKARGETKIIYAAKEPEIVDLQNFLNQMGAKISGAGTDVITIKGIEELVPITYQIIPDRIVAGTFITVVGIAGGSIELNNVIPEHLTSVIEYLKRVGVEIETDNDIMVVKRMTPLKAVEKIYTSPYPGFPTDMQAQMMTLLTLAQGFSIMEERVFDSRFKHVDELIRMGADIRIDQSTAYIRGVPYLTGAHVEATDLRAGAALILAGLAARGKTIVHQVHHVDRGYERIEESLNAIGAKILRESEN